MESPTPGRDQRQEQESGQEQGQEQGQVSEVDSLTRADEQIEPGDAVAGHPEDRGVQEGATGPEARTGDQDEETER